MAPSGPLGAATSPKTALLFGGQGERNLHDALRRALERGAPLIERALRAAGCTADDIFAGGGRLLEESRVLQPILVAFMLTDARRAARTGALPNVVAGHSLGELSAWAWAGAFTPDQAVDIAAARGRIMGEAAAVRPGGMLALTDVEEPSLEQVLAAGRAEGSIWIGAYNAPREVVLTGTHDALHAAARMARTIRLPVEGAWHSPLLEEASARFRTVLNPLPVRPLGTPLVSGLDGKLVRTGDEAIPRLVAHLTQPLRWTSTMQTLYALGVERFMIAGPARVLRHLIRKNLPEADVVVV